MVNSKSFLEIYIANSIVSRSRTGSDGIGISKVSIYRGMKMVRMRRKALRR